MSVTKFSDAELNAKLNKVRAKRQAAMIQERRLRGELRNLDRKLADQRKFVIGACVWRSIEVLPQNVEKLRALLLPHVTRETDRLALVGTQFEMGASESEKQKMNSPATN